MNYEVISLWGIWIFLLLGYGMMPFLTQKTIAFGVRIPSDMRQHPFLSLVLRRYWLGEGLAAILVLLIVHFSHLVRSPASGSAILLGLTLILLALNYVLAFLAVRARKVKEGWYENRHQASLAVPGATKLNPWLWLWWEIPAWALALGLFVAGVLRYPYLPRRIPVHFNSQGVANGWMNKNIFVVIFPVGISVSAILLATGILWLVVFKTRPDLDPSEPQNSTARSQIFHRRMIISLDILALASVFTTSLAALSTWGIISPSALPKIIPVAMLIALAAIFAITMKTGQEGRRVRPVSSEKTDSVHYDDDRFWKGGMVYYNPNDPKILVDKRFGVGWTLNFARPSVWVGLVVLILIALFPTIWHL